MTFTFRIEELICFFGILFLILVILIGIFIIHKQEDDMFFDRYSSLHVRLDDVVKENMILKKENDKLKSDNKDYKRIINNLGKKK